MKSHSSSRFYFQNHFYKWRDSSMPSKFLTEVWFLNCSGNLTKVTGRGTMLIKSITTIIFILYCLYIAALLNLKQYLETQQLLYWGKSCPWMENVADWHNIVYIRPLSPGAFVRVALLEVKPAWTENKNSVTSRCTCQIVTAHLEKAPFQGDTPILCGHLSSFEVRFLGRLLKRGLTVE